MYRKNAFILMSPVCDHSIKYLVLFLKGEHLPLLFSLDFMGGVQPLSEYFEMLVLELIKECGSEERDLKAFEFLASLIERPIEIIVDNEVISVEEVSKATLVYKNNPLFTGLYMFEKDDKCFLWDMSIKGYKIVDSTSKEWVLAIEKYNYGKEEVVEDEG